MDGITKKKIETPILYPEWLNELQGNNALVLIYSILFLTGDELKKNQIEFYKNGGSTPNKMIKFLETVGFKIAIPQQITHEIIANGKKNNVLTVITYGEKEKHVMGAIETEVKTV